MGSSGWILTKAAAARYSAADNLGPFDLGPARVGGAFDRYLDDARRSLWKQGFVCRLRQGGPEDLGYGVLQIVRRMELGWEVLADIELRTAFSWAAIARHLSPSAAALLRPLMGGWLDPWVTLVRPTTRRSVTIGGRAVAELAIEHVWQAEVRGRPVRTLTLTWAPRASKLDRQALASRVAHDAGLTLHGDLPAEALLALAANGTAPPFGFWKRLARTTGAVATPERQAVSGRIGHAEGLTLCEVAAILLDRLKQARRAYLACPEDPESLHDLRVVIRRLRSLLAQVAGPEPVRVPGSDHPGRSSSRKKARERDRESAEARNARKALGRLAKITNPARDADVMLDLAFELAGQDPLRAELAPLLVSLFERRQTAHDAVNAALESKQWRCASDAARRFSSARAAGKFLPRHDEVAGEAALSVLEPLHAAVGAIPVHDATPDRLHALRLAIKRLRYALESETLGLPGERAAHAAAKLADAQTLLGRHHDLTILRQAGADFSGQPYIESALTELLGRIDAQDVRLRRELAAIVPPLQTAAFFADLAPPAPIGPQTADLEEQPADAEKPGASPRLPAAAAATSSVAPRAPRKPSPSPGPAGRARAPSPRRGRRSPDTPGR